MSAQEARQEYVRGNADVYLGHTSQPSYQRGCAEEASHEPGFISSDMVRPSSLQKNEVALTSREYLYHLPCERSPRKLGRFGSRWLAPETAVRTFCVVVTSPAFRQDLRFLECVEQLAIEKLRPHFCSVMPSFRQASSTASPLPASSSTVRRC